MSGEPVIGLFGKLPAHGDFVRRGGPGAAFALLDRWIEGEATSYRALDALDGIRLAFVAEGRATLATAVASIDAIGRAFPVFALYGDEDGGGGIARDEAERWCAAAQRALGAVATADAAIDAIAAIAPPRATDAMATGWWRADGAGAATDGDLPRGPAFAAMLS